MVLVAVGTGVDEPDVLPPDVVEGSCSTWPIVRLFGLAWLIEISWLTQSVCCADGMPSLIAMASGVSPLWTV